jgi:hypothetical protein
MEPGHRRIAEIALAAAGEYGLALAGGYAVRAHGMGTRPSGDVDLFTDWHRRADFPAAVRVVVEALEEHGYTVVTVAAAETFVRLLVAKGDGTEPEKVELSADWRAYPPVLLDIGPVLHPDDAVVTSGRYSPDRLLELASDTDAGFDLAMFTDVLGALSQITDEAFAVYGVPPAEIAAMRKRFAAWRAEIRADLDGR